MLAQGKNKNIIIYNTDNWKNCIPLGMPRSVEKETIRKKIKNKILGY